MTNSTWIIIRASLETVGKLVLVGFCGFIAARKGYLNKPSLAALSKITFTFCMFCTLVTRLSSSVDDPADILNWWPMIVSCLSLIVVAAFFMRSIAYISGMKTKDARVFVHTFSFGNPTIIALAIVDSLTTDSTMFGEGADATAAKKRGTAYISTHLFMFSICFWIVGYIYINLNKEKEDESLLPLIKNQTKEEKEMSLIQSTTQTEEANDLKETKDTIDIVEHHDNDENHVDYVTFDNNDEILLQVL